MYSWVDVDRLNDLDCVFEIEADSLDSYVSEYCAHRYAQPCIDDEYVGAGVDVDDADDVNDE